MASKVLNTRLLFGSTAFVTQTYADHIKAVQTGGYAQGIDLVPCSSNGSYVPQPVLAHSAGVVIYAGNGDGYGSAVWIRHSDGYVTGYGHMANIYVKAGQSVIKGQGLGMVGSSGHSTGVHLHFEVRKYKTTNYTTDEKKFWSTDSFMNINKFDWVDPTPFINDELPTKSGQLHRVQVGAYKVKFYATLQKNKLVKDGYQPICKKYDGYLHLQVGAFFDKDNAEAMAAELRSKGYSTYVTTETGEDVAL